MTPTGIIFATLDCDLDSIEAWNRWYDLEHTPPNIAMFGVMLSRRYVAPPELHRIRHVEAGHAMADGHGSFITIYTLCEPPAKTVAAMSELREKLYAEGRMNYPAEKKAVRAAGGAMNYISGVSSSEIRLTKDEAPFVGHTAVLAVIRRCAEDVDAWYRSEWAERVTSVEGVHAVATFQPATAGQQLDLVYFEGDPVSQTAAIRAAAPHHADATILADAPFLVIDNLNYPWAERMRNSDLPKTIND